MSWKLGITLRSKLAGACVAGLAGCSVCGAVLKRREIFHKYEFNIIHLYILNRISNQIKYSCSNVIIKRRREI